jgi:hypothetical protein
MEATVVNEAGCRNFSNHFFAKIVKRTTLAGLPEVSAFPERASGAEKDEEGFFYFLSL